jgi:hypothetical protein
MALLVSLRFQTSSSPVCYTPNRRDDFCSIRESGVSEQAVVLTSRANTTDLHVVGACHNNVAFAFEDIGMALYAIANAKVFCIDIDEDKIPFSRANFKRLFELDVINKLGNRYSRQGISATSLLCKCQSSVLQS